TSSASRSSRLSRSDRMFAARPGIWLSRSLNRRGPSSSASTTSSVHRSPTLASAWASGECSSWRVVMSRTSGYAVSDDRSRRVDSALVSSKLQVTTHWEADMTVLDEIQAGIGQLAESAGGSVVGIGQRWGAGSGIVLGDGQVLTNAHNVRGDSAEVTFADGR